ncbi:hypothetical protein PQR02_40710, partial [Paraburkholderia sediminicola]
WTKVGFVAIALSRPSPGDENCLFLKMEILGLPRQMQQARKKISKQVSTRIWENMGALAGSGLLERQATTDLPGVRLSRVLVNALMTRRIRKCEKRRLLPSKPVVSTGGTADTMVH